MEYYFIQPKPKINHGVDHVNLKNVNLRKVPLPK